MRVYGLLLGASLFLPGFAEAETFGSGEHTFGGVTASVYVQGNAMVHIVASADIAYLDGYGTSNVDMSGGQISHAHFFVASSFQFNGGTISHLETHDTSHASLHSGNISHVRAY